MTLAAHCADPAIAAHVIRPAAFAAGALRSPEEIAGEVKARLVASRRAEIRQVSPAPEATAPEPQAPEPHAPEPHAIEPESPGLLRRPRLLARAAREGARMYRRERDLRTSLPGMTGPRKGVDIVSRLLGIEAQIEAERVSGAYSYSPMRHVGVLSALVAESLALAAKRAEG